MFICTVKKKTVQAVLLVFVLSALAVGIAPLASGLVKEDTKKLPIIMYHSVLRDKSRSGKYIVTPAEVEEDFKYLKENGYTAVLSEDVIAFTKGADFPEKAVMITFDDGYLNNATNVLPLLEKYDLKAVFSVVGSYTEKHSFKADHNPNYSYLSYEDIKALIKSGRAEIANHSYDLHRIDERVGCSIIKGEDTAAYKSMLSEDIKKTQSLLAKNADCTPVIFTYPFGSCCESAAEVVKKLGFKLSLGCGEKINLISRNAEDLYNLGRFNRESGTPTKNFMARLEK